MDDEPPNFHKLISLVNDYYQNLLGYKPEQTALQNVSEENWQSFAGQRGFSPNSSGIYLPRNQTAIIRNGNSLSLFHEYFGHGLFCEQSLEGRTLVELEKSLLEEERSKFGKKSFSMGKIKRFREGNEAFQKLKEYEEKNLILYEGFSLWTEYILSEKLDKKLFEEKYRTLPAEVKKYLDNIISFNEENGEIATFYNFGMARKITSERARRVLKGIYKNKLKGAKLAVLYGSRKEFSDMDILIISERLEEINSPWLDIRVENEKDFERGIKHFDISITDPVLTGEFLEGDKEYFNEKKKQLLEQPITKEAIKYNLKKKEEQERLALNYPLDSEENRHGLSYSQSYLANALSLKKGQKLLTYRKLFPQQKSINTSGGLI